MQFLRGFYAGTIDLGRVNRSYMVLLPKKPGAFTVDAFRPICLQNCSVKIGAKILTTRLQREITGLIDLDQTGFLKGRMIAENFVYAAELLQVCHKRKVPTLVLKLDFAKAFDTVNWNCLSEIMEVRGFDARWCSWVRSLLQTSRTAVLVNGCPVRGSHANGGSGKGIQCPRTYSSLWQICCRCSSGVMALFATPSTYPPLAPCCNMLTTLSF